MMDSVISLDKIVVRFRGKAALDGFSLEVPRGAVMALLGENGAGKSTCMKVLTGQIKPDRGQAQILGHNTWAKANLLRGHVGYVPDRPKLYDWMTISEIGWFAAGFFRDGYLSRYEEWTDRLRLDSKKKLKDLSKGGYARVGLALALAPDPDVLLLDEPTSGLDLTTRREFLASLVEFAAEGRTILISSHSIAELERTASHAAFVKDGKVALDATLDVLRTKFRRISMRCRGVIPDGSMFGKVIETQRTGRFIQFLIQDPDPVAVETIRDLDGITDFEDTSVGLEDIYSAVIGKPAEVTREESRREKVASSIETEIEEEEVQP